MANKKSEQDFLVDVRSLVDHVHTVIRAHKKKRQRPELDTLKNVSDILFSLEQELTNANE